MAIDSFDTNGFLSEESKKIKEEAIQKFSSLFQHAYALNKIAHRLKYLFKANNANAQQTLSVAVFIKILNDFQSIVLLAEKGLRLQIEVLLRSMLEGVFIVKLLCEDKAFYREYISQDALHRKKLINVACSNPHKIFESTRNLATEEFIKEIEDEIKEFSIQELKIVKLADRAGLLELYDSVYRITSGPTHASARSLNLYVKTNKNGEITEFSPGPHMDFDTEVETTINLLVVTLECLRKLFGLAEDRELEELVKQIIADRTKRVES